jgi:hypothetical protein
MRAIVTFLILISATQAACSPSMQQKDFASAAKAAQALVVAAQSDDLQPLLEVLGKEAEPVLSSGDPVQDANSRKRFLEAYAQARALDTVSEDVITLKVGTDEWPFPFPIVQHQGRWRFDGRAGTEEVVNRRIGANEISTIQSCLAFVDAQHEYYIRNPERDPLLHYALKLVSTEARKDGLYWSAASNEMPSPLGEAFARARSEGYFSKEVTQATPFHGYVYRLLKAQGPNAAGGAYEYVVRDQMLGGFALIASPAEYGSSGIMTFLVNHDGVVYSKDLGPDTAKAALAIESFDPDRTWTKEAVID